MHYLDIIIQKVSFFHLNVLLLLGLALFGGTIGGRLFQKFRIPQVVGYIVIGIILGQSGLNIVNKDVIASLSPINYFALGLIAFMVGGELKAEILRRYGKQFIYILLAEGMGAFFVVSLFASFAYFFYSHNLSLSIAIGILLGAIASATDAASTTNVLWEYKSKGVLTTTALGIVALDDGLSFLLFAIASSIASILIGRGESSLAHTILHPIWEIFGSIFVGLFSGRVLTFFLNRYTDEEKTLTFLLGGVLITLGLSISLGMDMLLAAMALGVFLTNSLPKRSKEVFSLIEKIAPPIYVLFFVLVGAKLKVSFFTPIVGILVALYLIGRTLGKMTGAYFGSVWSDASPKLRRYLGLCLFSQASAAIGLSILAAQVFPGDFGEMIIGVVTLTTFFVQLIGPFFVKIAIEKAGEAGRNITEDDLLKQMKVKQVMHNDVPVIQEHHPLPRVIDVLKSTDHLYYPVVDRSGRLKGVISMENIKNALALAELGDVVLAHDLLDSGCGVVREDQSLDEIKDLLQRFEFLAVVDSDNRVLGVVDTRYIDKLISSKIVELSKQSFED